MQDAVATSESNAGLVRVPPPVKSARLANTSATRAPRCRLPSGTARAPPNAVTSRFTLFHSRGVRALQTFATRAEVLGCSKRSHHVPHTATPATKS